ncbi:ATP-binding protein [Amycolatopsis eburnea]|uniref:ATP-binding protein n=1 Tax=Amycolatopsis eburnea TaxID=2267691 RepID=A0A3R9EKM6_9PSEU|nr:ATP-binding protein [Amycolatopsis eburnea]RSD09435.1 ATP-binding protein [Amycolatopsis eburnea]
MLLDKFAFDREPAQVRRVRSWVRDRLAATEEVPDEVAADVVLIAGELAANAVRHATGPVRALLTCADSTVWIGIEDSGGAAWFDPAAPDVAPVGTGLALIAACSRRRGHFHRADGGKTVWAEIPIGS